MRQSRLKFLLAVGIAPKRVEKDTWCWLFCIVLEVRLVMATFDNDQITSWIAEELRSFEVSARNRYTGHIHANKYVYNMCRSAAGAAIGLRISWHRSDGSRPHDGSFTCIVCRVSPVRFSISANIAGALWRLDFYYSSLCDAHWCLLRMYGGFSRFAKSDDQSGLVTFSRVCWVLPSRRVAWNGAKFELSATRRRVSSG